MFGKTFLISLFLTSVTVKCADVTNDTRTPGPRKSDVAAIVKSAKANGMPKWAVPGIVQALKEVYPTLDDSSKDKIKKTIDNPNLNLNKLMKELGGVVDNLSTADQERIRELLTKAEEERRAVAYAIYENTNMTDEEKELFAGLVESLIDPKTSLVGQCNSAKGLAGSVRKEMLGGLGIPDSITTIDCSTLSKSLLAS